MIAYFDTSALLKLVVAEVGSETARLLWHRAGGIVVSRLAWPESVGALAAARRGRRLTAEQHQVATRALSSCLQRCTVVSVADPIVDHGAELAGVYQLPAADAIHLATALAAVESDSVFITWDKRLGQAAALAGLVTAPAGV